MAKIYYDQQLEIALGTTRKLKYEVQDLNGSTAFSLVGTSTYRVKDVNGSVIVAESSATVNNSDEDENGNTIKTIEGLFDASASPLSTEGYYALIFKLMLDNGESDEHTIPVKVFTSEI